MKLTNRDIKRYKLCLDNLEQVAEKMSNCVHNVLILIHKAFGKKCSSWWFANAREGEVGAICLDELLDKDGDISYTLGSCDGTMVTWNWSYEESFPRRFLLMDDDQILSEIKNNIKATKRVAWLYEEEKNLKAAVEKLTLEERKDLEIS